MSLLLNRKVISYIFMVLIVTFLGCFSALSQKMILLYITFCILSFFLIFKRPLIAIVMILSVLSIYQLLGYIPHFEIGTWNIFLGDVLAIIFTIAAILRLSMNTQSQTIIHSFPWKLFVIFSALAIVGILRGLPNYGQTTIVHARGYIYVIATTAYFCTFRFDKYKINRILPIFIIFGILLLSIAYLRWIEILPPAEYLLKYEGTWLGERMLNRNGAFYLVFVLFVFIVSKINKVTRKHILSWIALMSLVIAIILIQFRTMWVIVFIGFIVLTFKYRLKFISKAPIALFLFFILIFFLWFCSPTTISRIGNYLYNAATVFWKPEHSTLSWRISGIKAYLKRMSLKGYILGMPFGTPISYEVAGVRLKAGVHNMFIEQVYRTGVFGLAIFILLQFFLIRKIHKILKEEKDKLIKNSLVILWITLICYQVLFMGWTADFLYPIILGISISMVAHYEYDKKIKLLKINNE